MGLLRRNISTELLSALTGEFFFPSVMVALDWPGGYLYLHSGLGEITFNGKVWQGVGNFGSISYPGESAGLVATRVILSLYNFPEESMDELAKPIRNREGFIYFGAVETAGGNSLRGSPVEVFSGFMDASRYTLQPSTGEGEDRGSVISAVQVDLGSGPSARAVASLYHSFESQDRAYPGDTAGRHLIGIEASVGIMRWPEE